MPGTRLGKQSHSPSASRSNLSTARANPKLTLKSLSAWEGEFGTEEMLGQVRVGLGDELDVDQSVSGGGLRGFARGFDVWHGTDAEIELDCSEINSRLSERTGAAAGGAGESNATVAPKIRAAIKAEDIEKKFRIGASVG